MRTTVADSRLRAPGAEPASGSAEPALARGWRARMRSSPFLVSTLVCVVLAGLSAALLPTVPSYDPWSWIVWGREVFDPHLSFTVSGGPSWKPLPVLFTAVFGLFGGASPMLWVITARAGGLLGLVAAYRLASLVVRSWPASEPLPWAPVIAGLFAAVGVALTQEWSYYMFRGTSEPMLVAATLWAVDRHIAGRYSQALALGVAASLIRPEAWPFIFIYGVWLWRRDRSLRTAVVVLSGLAMIPLLWFGPPWIGTGQPFIAASHAKDYNGHLGAHPFLEVLRRGFDLQPAPWLVLGVATAALAWSRRPRNVLVLGLAAAAAAWWVLVVGMTVEGYPGLERFFLPAAGLTCVLGGAGLVELGRLGARVLGERAGGLRFAAAGLVVVVIALSVPFSTSRIDQARAQRPIASRAVTRLDQLTAAVASVGGHAGVYPCRSSFAAVNHSAQTALAWKLHVTLERVGTSMRHPGVMFVGPHDSIDGGAPAISHALNRIALIGQVGPWRIYRVWRFGHLTTCVGR